MFLHTVRGYPKLLNKKQKDVVFKYSINKKNVCLNSTFGLSYFEISNILINTGTNT